jgi:serine/threonine-protein kinase
MAAAFTPRSGSRPSSGSRERSSTQPITSSSDGSRFPPGALLAGRYRIIAILGRGGMGEVYRADDLTLGQQVALKFLPPAVAANATSVDRFRNEVRVARLVSHPNVCRVYDLGEMEGNLFLSMEYIDGEDLGSLLKRIGRLPADKGLEIARKLCAGLAAAHEKGVLHRDLKPGNIMLDARGQVLLTDFGLAGLVDRIEGAEVRNGTPAYMAPEQLAGTEVTVRSDIYSLGLVLYEILTGKRPYESDTVEGLERARRKNTPLTPSTLVKDLDPRVERVILRCLESDPSRRPASAFAVAAALPGGDPLAAALAAGETPSPEMVAAAGEGSCFTPRVAFALLLAITAGMLVQGFLQYRLNALDRIGFDMSPEVLTQKAKDLLNRLGYTKRPADDASGFDVDNAFARYVASNDKPPMWERVLRERPPILIFQYRQSDAPMVPDEFHDDKLTPGLITMDDPPLILSGMISMETDVQGRLLDFEAIPPQVLEPAAGKVLSPPDWNVLFAAADLDPAKFQPAEPQRTWLATSDAREAWTGVWPGTDRPLRVEAAALRGKPVAFALISPWSQPNRLATESGPSVNELLQVALLILILTAGPMLAIRNYRQNKSDRRGAWRLAVFIFCAQMLMWILRAHFTPTLGLVMPLVMALCSSLFYGVMLWTIYMAIEPYVRRHWPHAIISWSNVLTGHWRDPVVGRDVLFGAGLGVAWSLIGRAADTWGASRGGALNFGDAVFLSGFRRSLGRVAMDMPDSVRTALIFFLLIFLLRVVLRNRWIAGAAFVAIFVTMQISQSNGPIAIVSVALNYGIAALVVERLGLLSLAVGVFIVNLLANLPITLNASAPYFGEMVLVLAIAFAMCVWAFHTSTAGRRLWSGSLFE